MPYNPTHNIAFTLIPRNASASIAKALSVVQEFTPPDEEARELLTEDDPWASAAVRFACVRPVFDRFFSTVCAIAAGNELADDNLQSICSSFILTDILDHLAGMEVLPLAFAPQTQWLKRAFDHLVPLEYLATFFNAHGLPSLPALNATKGARYIASAFRQEIEALPSFQAVYGKDVELLTTAPVWTPWPIKATVNGPCPTCK